MKESTWTTVDESAASLLAALETKPAGRACDTVVPEETIFGILSRYHVLTGNPTSGNTLIELLGRRSITPSTAFPSSLHLISKHLQLPVDTIDDLIEGHTILPGFRPFMSFAHYTRIAHSMASGAANNTKISLGMLASRVGANDVLRFCPACAKCDCQTIGVATWYRAHQFPGVLVCPYHGVFLAAYYGLAQHIRRHQLFLPTATETWVGHQSVQKIDELAREKLLHVSRLIAQLLSLRSAPIDPLAWRNHCFAHLVDRGLATTTLRVRQRELRNELLEFWEAIRNLPVFDAIFARCGGNDSWLTCLYRRPRSTHHPLLHVLLIGFLAESIESFLQAGPSFTAFASPPRREASAVLDDKITALVSEGRSMRHVAKELGLCVNTVLVKAEKINVEFTRRSKKISAAVRLQVQHALAAGDPISKILHTTGLSASTVNRILGAQLGIQTQRATSLQNKRQVHARGKLCAARLASPSAGFKALQAALSADFIWLYRHDRAWLQAQLLSAPKIPVLTSSVDWGARDSTMLERVKLAVAGILEPSTRPVRVTVNEIARRTGNASWLEKHLVRLPQTATLLHKVLEPAAGFRARLDAWRKNA